MENSGIGKKHDVIIKFYLTPRHESVGAIFIFSLTTRICVIAMEELLLAYHNYRRAAMPLFSVIKEAIIEQFDSFGDGEIDGRDA